MARSQLFSVIFACLVAIVGCDNSDDDGAEIINACLVPPSDFDLDGVDNDDDNCVIIKNFDQKDTDDDGIGDVCDEESTDSGNRVMLKQMETAGC